MDYDKYKEELIIIKKEEASDKNFPKSFLDFYSFEKPYREKRAKLNNKYKILFKHKLCDAWLKPINKILVLDKQENNIIITYGYFDIYKEYTIAIDDINKFKELLMNETIYKRTEVLSPPILDGSSHQLYISNLNDSIEIDCHNIWYWNGDNRLDNIQSNEKISQNEIDYTKMIIKITNQLQSILDKNKIKFTVIESNDKYNN